MPELRLALIAIAVVLVVAVYLYSRWQGNGRNSGVPTPRRRPRVDHEDLPSISVSRPSRAPVPEPPAESRAQARLSSLKRRLSIGLSNLAASDAATSVSQGEEAGAELAEPRPRVEPREEPDPAAEALKGFDPDAQKIVSLHVLAVGERGLDGNDLKCLLEDNGCRHGQYGIFHRSERNSEGRPSLLFSVANIVEPGQFNLETMAQEHYRGVTLFAVLPGPWAGIDSFHEMLSLARRLAETLGGDVRDEARNAFSRQRATHIEEQIIEFERLRHQKRTDRRGS